MITQATVRLHGIPEATAAAISSFNSIQNAVETVVQILQCGLPLARIEFLNSDMIRACNSFSNLDMKEAPTLFLEFIGSPVSEVSYSALIQVLLPSHCDHIWLYVSGKKLKLHEHLGSTWSFTLITLICAACVPNCDIYTTYSLLLLLIHC